jgi:hypothetical protein
VDVLEENGSTFCASPRHSGSYVPQERRPSVRLKHSPALIGPTVGGKRPDSGSHFDYESDTGTLGDQLRDVRGDCAVRSDLARREA